MITGIFLYLDEKAGWFDLIGYDDYSSRWKSCYTFCVFIPVMGWRTFKVFTPAI